MHYFVKTSLEYIEIVSHKMTKYEIFILDFKRYLTKKIFW